ncbi:cysteine proteinase inhibitor 1 [Phtheirospermum japonicum]|uniref:Cysteine proteinase inhibitor 1 n=1 Tax=Phtheirospermum japonicum TaxID=374723 RepID=A0A830BLS2_9LAMI|nr:cysteine proteinase inhibitor 1 [Phtheirospermum japonicum]
MAARFAISEHNKKAKKRLSFVTVAEKGKQVVHGGFVYRLVISAKDGDTRSPINCYAVVWLRASVKDMILMSFMEMHV